MPLLSQWRYGLDRKKPKGTAALAPAWAGANLIGAWLLNEAGAKVNDYSLLGNAGTVTLGTGAWKGGNFAGPALSFDGATTVINVGDAPTLNPGKSISAVAWVYPTAFQGGSTNGIVSKSKQITAAGWGLYADGSGNLAFTTFKSGGASTTGTALALNKWSQVAATYDYNSGIQKVFINGAKVASTAGVTVNTDAATALRIGFGQDALAVPWTGLIDHVLFFNRPLADQAIVRLYNEPFAVFNRPPPVRSMATALAAFNAGLFRSHAKTKPPRRPSKRRKSFSFITQVVSSPFVFQLKKRRQRKSFSSRSTRAIENKRAYPIGPPTQCMTLSVRECLAATALVQDELAATGTAIERLQARGLLTESWTASASIQEVFSASANVVTC